MTLKNRINEKNIKSKENLFDPSLKSGLYLITCFSTEKHYVGESDYVIRRINAHKSALRRGIHTNSEMQKDFDQYGIDNFLFQKLFFGKCLPKDERQKFETIILSTLPEKNRYNVFTNWRERGSLMNPFYGKKHSPETKAELSLAKKGQPSPFAGHRHTDEVRERVSQENRGKKDRKKSVVINSVFYESISQAEEKLGISRRLIRQRCHSVEKRFANYQWVKRKENQIGEIQ